MGNFVEHDVRTNDRKVVVNALALGQVPFEEPHQGAPPAQMCREFRAGDPYEVFGDRVRIVRDYNLAALPDEPIEVGYSALDVEPAAVRSDSLADGSAPVVD